MSKEEAGLYGETLLSLGAYGKDALPSLLTMFKETKDKESRRNVIFAIQELKDKDIVAPLMEVIRDRTNDAELRAAAIRKVAFFGPAESFGELMELYQGEKDDLARYNLIDAIGKSRSQHAIPFLENILVTDPDSLSRSSAAHALGDIGGPRVESILLSALEKEKAPSVRGDIAYSLKKLTGKEHDWQKPRK
jgi:HEAT repeat protein